MSIHVEIRIRHIDLWQIWWSVVKFFGKQIFFTTDISHTFCRSTTKFVRVRGLAKRNLFSKFHELFSRDPVHDTMQRHASVLYWYTCKVVFRQLPMFVDSFSVLSIHCVARGLGTSFLYKCLTSRGGSLRQHDLLVAQLTAVSLYFTVGRPLPFKITPSYEGILAAV